MSQENVEALSNACASCSALSPSDPHSSLNAESAVWRPVIFFVENVNDEWKVSKVTAAAANLNPWEQSTWLHNGDDLPAWLADYAICAS